MSEDPRDHVGPALLDYLAPDLLNQLVLSSEVVADQSAADPDPLGDARQRRTRVSDLGDRVDRRRDDLRSSRGLDEGSLSLTARSWPHDQKFIIAAK